MMLTVFIRLFIDAIPTVRLNLHHPNKRQPLSFRVKITVIF
jgi:hypothetical protein